MCFSVNVILFSSSQPVPSIHRSGAFGRGHSSLHNIGSAHTLYITDSRPRLDLPARWTCIHNRMLLRSNEIHHQCASAQQACSCLTSSLIDAWTYARLHKQHTSSSPSASRTCSNKGLLESLTALRHPHLKQDRRPDLFHSPSCRGDAQRVHTSYTEQLQTQLSERSKASTLSLPDTRSQISMLQ